ncbi:MAG: glycosyltransferase [Sedimentisphaerales bacterium]|nr:glycosyltransferase [Sedimentisphaerales bacterium]
MRILVVGDLQYDRVRFMINNTRMFCKGFTRLGHDVLEFGYRNMLEQLSWLPSKSWSERFFKKRVDDKLVELAGHHRPDMVFITAFRILDGETIGRLKESLPNAIFICWYGDPLPGVDGKTLAIGKHCDWFLATGAGKHLERVKAAGVKRCGFLPNPTDKDVEYHYDVEPRYRSKMVFIGKLKHSHPEQDTTREELIKRLVAEHEMTVYACLGRPGVMGLDYLKTICGTDIMLSINACNDVPLYHSDRLTHCMGCGAFTLAKYVPGSERMFEDGRHLCYFRTIEECMELVERYKADADARNRIGQAALQRAHTEFSCEKLAGHVVELMEQGEFKADWTEFI